MRFGVTAATCGLATALLSGTALARDYLPGVPMESVAQTQVRDCRVSGAWPVPIITWGADEVTLRANGDQVSTASGSAFAKAGLSVALRREDDFQAQVAAYEECRSPFLRATLGMAEQAAGITEADPRTKMVAIFQHSWSAGGDVLVARAEIRKPSDLKGRTIVVQRYGPHVDYMLRVLSDAGLSPSDVTIRYVHGLTMPDADNPMAAMRADPSVAAAFVISPDAATLTSGGGASVGSGAEGSVKGAHQLLSTHSANRVIADLYFVRRDFYDANKDKLQAFVGALFDAEAQMRDMARPGGADWNATMKAAAAVLLDNAGAVDDAKGLWSDAETAGRAGNARFFADQAYPRSFDALQREVAPALAAAGLVSGTRRIAPAEWDWARLTGTGQGGAGAAAPEKPRFDPAGATQAVTGMHAKGSIDDDTLFEFSINFKLNQQTFPESLYAAQFAKVVDLASTYGGAVISAEGHADPYAYVQAAAQMQKSGNTDTLMLGRKIQAARNLSIQRAQAVRKAVIDAAAAKGVVLDPSQFVTVGMGYDDPVVAVPKTIAESESNMRVVFRVVNVEAESNASLPAR